MKESTKRFFKENETWAKDALIHYSQEGEHYRHLADAVGELREDGFLDEDSYWEFRRKYRSKSNSMWDKHGAIRDVIDIIEGREPFWMQIPFEGGENPLKADEGLAVQAVKEFIAYCKERR